MPELDTPIVTYDGVEAKFTITLEDFEANLGEMLGFCVSCGEYREGCEPDARRYKCEVCGERAVYGLEELLIMGLVK